MSCRHSEGGGVGGASVCGRQGAGGDRRRPVCCGEQGKSRHTAENKVNHSTPSLRSSQAFILLSIIYLHCSGLHIDIVLIIHSLLATYTVMSYVIMLFWKMIVNACYCFC